MTAPLFLSDDELAELTGRKLRRLQIEALRLMAIPFRVNLAGRPVVCRSAIEGREPAYTAEPVHAWQPAVLNHGPKTH